MVRRSIRKVRAKAPLRLGLAGGGTDVSPYSDMFGGMVLNATISLYAHCSITLRSDGKFEVVAADFDKRFKCDADLPIPVDHDLGLICQVYNRFIRDYNGGEAIPMTITTSSDVPAGSGLGSSSTMVVATAAAFAELLQLPLGEYELAHLAYEIERVDMKLAGGKQDQYAATFGGFNLMEFMKDDRVIINPLRIRPWIIAELESSLILYFTGRSRESAHIINAQQESVKGKEEKPIEAMHALKEQARHMKDALLLGNFEAIASELRSGWLAKKQMAEKISNSDIDRVMEAAMNAGANGGKVSGAGGGGFIMFTVQPERRANVIKALEAFDGKVFHCVFTEHGATAWRLT